MAKRRRAARVWDVCATTLASACLFHCLALPLLATMAPITSQLVDNHLLHLVMVLLAIPVTLWVIYGEGISGEGVWFTPVAFAGLTMMVLAVTLFEAYEVIMTVLGGLMLGGAHLWRWSRHQPAINTMALEDDG